MQVINYNEDYTNILNAKYNLMIAYSIVENENWTIIHENILKSDNYISNIINKIDENDYNQYNKKQAYIAIKELENLINIKDKDIFYLKYNIAIEKLNSL